jgi:hypothetical protein
MHYVQLVLLAASALAALGAITLVAIRHFTGWEPWNPLVFRIFLGIAFVLWLNHYLWARDWYSRPYSGWPGLYLFDATSVLLALACGALAVWSASRRPLLAALAPLPLGYYWLLTYHLLLWRPPALELTITDLRPEFTLSIQMAVVVVFLSVYVWAGRPPRVQKHLNPDRA